MLKPLVIALALALAPTAQAATTIPAELKPPVRDGIWLRPATDGPAEPTIGFRNGIRVGLWPAPSGPRGIIRIYAPYVLPGREHPLINFIAIEPVVKGRRSYSELEHSALDDANGKRLWFSDELDPEAKPAQPWQCPAGKLGKINVDGKDVPTLSIVVNAEKLDNGAQPIVRITFREDRPNEITLNAYSATDGASMESCVLTSTMGNYSRARLLWLQDEVVDSRDLWPCYTGSEFVHTPDYPMDRMLRSSDGTITVAVTPSETDLAAGKVDRKWWYFDGRVSTQYWRKCPATIKSPVSVRVNGRAIYYGTSTTLPGGIAYENFEIIEEYKPGVESVFGVTLRTPAQMGWKVEKK